MTIRLYVRKADTGELLHIVEQKLGKHENILKLMNWYIVYHLKEGDKVELELAKES